ncbi:spermatogenesis-associated protein 7 homolog [Brachionichthys hirsutus]|uniref:spermatogenesis-associated protein 7 homolog n=1 Tax=Brachionichthys hirsutus TaxID=412623 RepID=UPI003604E2C5
MGFIDRNVESRVGSILPGLRCSPNMTQQTWKRSSFSPSSSSKLAQSIIKDHMMSHYKKVYSAKAAIDASTPKSLTHSVKYNDQKRQAHSRNSGRSQSAHTFSQRNSRTSCSSAQGRFYDDSPYFGSRSSAVSSPRFGTSFHIKDIVYPLSQVSSQNPIHRSRPGSEIKYLSPGTTSQRKQSAGSLAISRSQTCYKAFEDPFQKTYNGDLLKKHSHNFTQEKPFTPQTLKSDKSSFLSKYRYYRAPRKKSPQVCPQPRVMHQEASDTKDKEDAQEFHDSSQGLNTEHEWSGDEFSDTYLESRQQSLANSRHFHFNGPSSRVPPEGGKSSRNDVSAEEEELMYLELISAVTEDVLSRQYISERVIDRVIKRHIDRNRDQLDEGKMLHLLEVLRKDFQEPNNAFHAEFERKDNTLLDAFLPHLKSGKRQMETLCPSPQRDSAHRVDPLLVSTPKASFERTASPPTTNENEGEDDNPGKVISSPWHSKHRFYDERISKDDSQLIQRQATATNSNEGHEYACKSDDKGFHQDQIEVSCDEQSKELEDLGTYLSTTLHVSGSPHHNNLEATQEYTKEVPLSSDDEF